MKSTSVCPVHAQPHERNVQGVLCVEETGLSSRTCSAACVCLCACCALTCQPLQKKSNWDAPPDQALAAIEPSANNPQLTFKARRIYVGNLPQTPPIDQTQLREFFDQVWA
jgi:hypothetical protein